MINQDRLKELLTYEPLTGIFKWRVKRNGKNGGVNPGDTAGSNNGYGYLMIGIDGKKHMVSRLAFLYMLGDMPDGDVDHISGDTKDNRWGNLRVVTRQENMRNTKLPSTNSTGHIGVTKCKSNGRFHAYIYVDGKKRHIGSYETIDEAVAARSKAQCEHGFHENHGRRTA